MKHPDFFSVLDEARACDDAKQRIAMLDEARSQWKACPQLLALLAEAHSCSAFCLNRKRQAA